MSLPPPLFTRLCVCIDDPVAWSECLPYLETLPLATSSPFYSRALALYPSTGPVVLSAVRAHSSHNDPAGVQRILYSHLERTPYPPLWAYYCGFVEGQKLQPALASLEAAQRASATPASSPSPGATAAADATSTAAILAAAQKRVRECREEVLQAYKFAVERVGGLWGAEVVHQAYIAFTQTLPVDGAFNLGYARESQREALLKASTSAHAFTNAAWEAYTTFERGGGAASKLSDALIAKALKAHTLASEASRQKGGLWGVVDVARLPGFPREVVGGESGEVLFSLPSSEGGSSGSGSGSGDGSSISSTSSTTLSAWHQGTKSQSLAWRAVIGYELTNPQELPAPALESAVSLIFTAALGGPMRACPEVWYEFALFKGLSGKGGGGFEVLRQARGVLPTCTTLALAAADAYEALGQWEEANAVVEELVGELGRVADGGGRLQSMAIRTAVSTSGREEGGGGGGRAATSTSSSSDAHPLDSLPPPPMFAALDALLRGEGEEEAWREAGIPNPPPYCTPSPPSSKDLVGASPPPSPPPLPTLLTRVTATPQDALLAAAAIPGVYIVQQRRVRRCQGAEAARDVFSQARKSPYVTPDVYLASARLEYFSNGRDISVPRNILEAGRKRFPTSIDFLASACDFLALHDDSDSARGFIEGVLGGLSGGGLGGGSGNPQPSRPFWDRLLALELTLCPGGGSLEGVKEVERRRGEAHPYLVGEDTRPLQRLIHRWAVLEGGAAPPSTWVDTALCTRYPVAPGATLPMKVYTIGGGRDEEGGGEGGGSTWGRIVHVDGLHLQVSRELGLSPNTFEGGAGKNRGGDMSKSGRVIIPPLPPPPPPIPSQPPPFSSSPPTPPPPVIIPAFLAPFLSKLPAFAPELGPIPSVDTLIQSLCAFKEVYEEEEGSKGVGGLESEGKGEGGGEEGDALGGSSSSSSSSSSSNKRSRVEE